MAKSLYESLYELRKSMRQADGVNKLKAKARMLDSVLQGHSVAYLNVPQKGGNVNWPWMEDEALKLLWGLRSTGKQDKSPTPMSVSQTHTEGKQSLQLMWNNTHVHGTGILSLLKTMANLDGILKSRDITLLTKVCRVKAMVLPVVMYGCESWTIKAERWRINAFELWCWKTPESPLDSKIKPVNPKGNQPWT